jgi:hypothetical protein
MNGYTSAGSGKLHPRIEGVCFLRRKVSVRGACSLHLSTHSHSNELNPSFMETISMWCDGSWWSHETKVGTPWLRGRGQGRWRLFHYRNWGLGQLMELENWRNSLTGFLVNFCCAGEWRLWRWNNNNENLKVNNSSIHVCNCILRVL